jgi:hypothetical protein
MEAVREVIMLFNKHGYREASFVNVAWKEYYVYTYIVFDLHLYKVRHKSKLNYQIKSYARLSTVNILQKLSFPAVTWSIYSCGYSTAH